jgi:hypothetical protein
MNKLKNKYALKAQKEELMGLGNTATASDSKSKSTIDYKKTMANTGRDILIGGIGGGLAGTIMGRFSFLTGIVVAGLGHAISSPATAGFGIGLMASGGFQGVKSVNGVEGTDGVDGIKERLTHYKDTIKKQFFIDKLPKSKKAKQNNESTDEATNGMGNVQYFKHPNSEEAEMNGANELDFSEANKLEQQIEASAKAYAQKQGMSGDFSGTESNEVDGLDGELSDRLI